MSTDPMPVDHVTLVPALLSITALLAFGEDPWQDSCRRHGHTVACMLASCGLAGTARGARNKLRALAGGGHTPLARTLIVNSALASGV